MTNRALLDLDSLHHLFDHDVASVTDLVTLGLSGRMIDERCQDGGPWRRLHPGLVLLGSDPPSRSQRIAAALRTAGPGAVLTGVDALVRHGMRAARLQGPVHVLMLPRRHSKLVDGVFFDRTHSLPVPQLRHGFPVAPLARATIDTCRRAKSAEHVRALLTEAIHRGRLSPATLRAELTQAARGVALADRILGEIENGVRSMAHAWARRLVDQWGLPVPQWQVPVSDRAGGLLPTPDAWWEDVALAWVVSAHGIDPSVDSVHATLARTSQLAAAGIRVLHTPPTQLRDDPAAVAALLRDAHDNAALRPLHPPAVAA